MRPRIAKTTDRIPFPPGTTVAYWNWVSATEALPTHYTGITRVLSADDIKNMTDMGGNRPVTAPGEEVICLTDANGNLTGQYERIHHLDPMEDEPQRWFPVGVDPMKPEAATPEYRNSPPVIFDERDAQQN